MFYVSLASWPAGRWPSGLVAGSLASWSALVSPGRLWSPPPPPSPPPQTQFTQGTVFGRKKEGGGALFEGSFSFQAKGKGQLYLGGKMSPQGLTPFDGCVGGGRNLWRQVAIAVNTTARR